MIFLLLAGAAAGTASAHFLPEQTMAPLLFTLPILPTESPVESDDHRRTAQLPSAIEGQVTAGLSLLVLAP